MLFLHGYGASHKTFYYQLDYFSRYFKVYAPDLPGFSEPLLRPYNLSDYAEIVLNFINNTGESDFSVIAHSFGARIVLKLSPFPFKKIVLTGAAGLKTKKTPSYYFKIWGYKSIKRIFGEKPAKMFSQKFNQNGIEDMPYNNRLSFIKIVNEPLDYKLKTIYQQTLIIQGKSDKETPLYLAKKFNKGIKDSQLILIDGGHFAFIDSFNCFNLIAKEFLLNNSI